MPRKQWYTETENLQGSNCCFCGAGGHTDETTEFLQRGGLLDKDDYELFVVDYNVDTINPDNEGIYMIEISRSGHRTSQLSWQERLYAGIHSPKE